jgi:Phosphotransferase enzyme family
VYVSATARDAEAYAPDPADAAAVAVAAAGAALGRPVALAAGPRPRTLGFGEGAFTCRLADVLEPLWSGPLVVRVGDPDALGAEFAWHRWAEGQGFPTPRALACWPGPPAGLVLADPGLEPSIERMASDFAAIPTIIGSLGRLQARLHSVPCLAAPGPVLDWPAALARLDAKLAAAGPVASERDMARQRAWLGAHDPGPVVPVPCHGALSPINVHLHRTDATAALVASWGDAVLSDREYDLASSHLALWSSPYVAPDRSHRRLLKMARAAVIAGYDTGYRATGAGADDARLASWGAYHACAFSVATATAPVPAAEENGWKPADLVKVRAGYRRDLAKRFDVLAAEADRFTGS